MKVPAIVLGLLLLASLGLTSHTLAKVTTDINVSSNGDNARSHVSVDSTSNINVNGESTNGESCTKIRIEENGEVKEYESCDGGSVNLESGSGNARVNIHNNSTGSNSASPRPAASSTPEPTVSPSPEATSSPIPSASPSVEATAEGSIFPPDSFFDELSEFLDELFSDIL